MNGEQTNAIRILAVLDDTVVSGKVKPVLAFARAARADARTHQPCDVSMVTFVRNADDPGFVEALREEGFVVDVIRERRRFDLSVFAQLRAIVTARRPHIIWTHGAKTHFLVRIAGLHRAARWMASHHGYTATSFMWKCYDQLDRWSLRAAHKVITVCDAFAADLRSRLRIPAARISVHRSPIAPSAAAHATTTEMRKRLGLPLGEPIVLCVGRLSKEKGHAILLEAMAQVRQTLPARLLLVGDGPEQESLERLCRQLKLTAAVDFAGYQDDVSPYYAAADVFALPSFSEGSPNVLLEAMDAGVPIVATAVGGVPEMITHGREAWLVPSNDSRRLADGIIEVLRNGALREALVAQSRRSLEGYHPAKYYAGLRPLLEELAFKERSASV